jgi:hypothetical protein
MSCDDNEHKRLVLYTMAWPNALYQGCKRRECNDQRTLAWLIFVISALNVSVATLDLGFILCLYCKGSIVALCIVVLVIALSRSCCYVAM